MQKAAPIADGGEFSDQIVWFVTTLLQLGRQSPMAKRSIRDAGHILNLGIKTILS
jgi:hypothetical protein